jgi:hypothetical protein
MLSTISFIFFFTFFLLQLLAFSKVYLIAVLLVAIILQIVILFTKGTVN